VCRISQTTKQITKMRRYTPITTQRGDPTGDQRNQGYLEKDLRNKIELTF